LTRIEESLVLLLPLTGTGLAVGFALWGAHWLLIGRFSDLGSERKFTRQLILLGLSLLGIMAVVLVLPISDNSRNRLLGLFGILISGVLAFSSTSIFSNLAAGVLLRITKPFRTGDFIQIGDHFGRVSERGLFDTEIQTETRELVSLPNSFCIGNPVTTIRSSGTIISASLSLGYDAGHAQVEPLLVHAAKAIDLKDPFVHITELGDFAVTYRVSGLLQEPKFLLSSRSRLYASVLDTLHAEGIEIMSPAYMNQRRLGDGHRAIPPTVTSPDPDTPVEGSVEAIAFDKAERAGELENEKQNLVEAIKKAEEASKHAADEAEKHSLKTRIDQAKERLKAIEKAAEDINSEDEKAENKGADKRSD
jgi:small-conductance mechanosensitive channel